jgi:hypothetical protein
MLIVDEYAVQPGVIIQTESSTSIAILVTGGTCPDGHRRRRRRTISDPQAAAQSHCKMNEVDSMNSDAKNMARLV